MAKSIMVAVTLIALAAAGGSGYVAWQKHAELQRANAELASTRALLAKATADLGAARQQAATLEKDLVEQRAAAEEMRAERDSARNLLAAEAEQGNRLRADLQLMKEQLAFMRARPGPAQFAPPSAVRPSQPMVVRAAPGGRAVGAPLRAMPPQQ